VNLRTGFDFVLLAALWGSSFLFMRVAVPEFGAFALAGMRVSIAGLILVALVAYQRKLPALVKNWKPIAGIGVLNSALPFLLFAYALNFLNSGLGAILNATVPLWGAVVAFIWLKDRMSGLRVFGLVIGFVGVILLVWNKVSFKPGIGLAVIACLTATFFYGIAASATKRFLTGVDSLCSAAGSQLSAAVVLLPFALIFWPDHVISNKAWLATVALAVFCTAIAYILYFRLFAALGPAKTITVTFMIPIFGMTWGAIFLNETLTLQMIVACAIILVGTSITTGVLSSRSIPAISQKPLD
jgi:drug/metabolite transporter (DMT)-like permease